MDSRPQHDPRGAAAVAAAEASIGSAAVAALESAWPSLETALRRYVTRSDAIVEVIGRAVIAVLRLAGGQAFMPLLPRLLTPLLALHAEAPFAEAFRIGRDVLHEYGASGSRVATSSGGATHAGAMDDMLIEMVGGSVQERCTRLECACFLRKMHLYHATLILACAFPLLVQSRRLLEPVLARITAQPAPSNGGSATTTSSHGPALLVDDDPALAEQAFSFGAALLVAAPDATLVGDGSAAGGGNNSDGVPAGRGVPLVAGLAAAALVAVSSGSSGVACSGDIESRALAYLAILIDAAGTAVNNGGGSLLRTPTQQTSAGLPHHPMWTSATSSGSAASSPAPGGREDGEIGAGEASLVTRRRNAALQLLCAPAASVLGLMSAFPPQAAGGSVLERGVTVGEAVYRTVLTAALRHLPLYTLSTREGSRGPAEPLYALQRVFGGAGGTAATRSTSFVALWVHRVVTDSALCTKSSPSAMAAALAGAGGSDSAAIAAAALAHQRSIVVSLARLLLPPADGDSLGSRGRTGFCDALRDLAEAVRGMDAQGGVAASSMDRRGSGTRGARGHDESRRDDYGGGASDDDYNNDEDA